VLIHDGTIRKTGLDRFLYFHPLEEPLDVEVIFVLAGTEFDGVIGYNFPIPHISKLFYDLHLANNLEKHPLYENIFGLPDDLNNTKVLILDIHPQLHMGQFVIHHSFVLFIKMLTKIGFYISSLIDFTKPSINAMIF